jgi:hypothetical protein
VGARPREDRPGRGVRGLTALGMTGATVFGVILALKLVDEDFRGEHLEYFVLGALVSLALLAVGLLLGRLRRPGGP